MLNKGEDPQKPKEGDDLKGAIPKGFEKFFKKKGEDQPSKESGSSPKKEEPQGKAANKEDKKEREEG